MSTSSFICQHTNFIYSIPLYDKDIFTPYDVENAVRENIFQIKCQLLYFDNIDLPLGSLVKPRSQFSKKIAESLFKNKAFLDLIENGLIVSSVYEGTSPEETFLRRQEHNRKINWDLKTSIYDNILKYELSNINFYERDIETQVFQQGKNLHETIQNISIGTIRKNLFQIYKDAEKKSSLEFSRPYFYQEAIKQGDARVLNFLNILNPEHFQSAESANLNLIVPYHYGADNLLRKSLNSGTYAFLYGEEMYLEFLSFFCEEIHIKNIAKLPAASLLKLRKDSSWKAYLDFYHQILEKVSVKLHLDSIDKIQSTAKFIFIEELNRSIPGIAVDITYFMIKSFTKPINNFIKEWNLTHKVDLMNNRLKMRINDKNTGEFINSLIEELKACA